MKTERAAMKTEAIFSDDRQHRLLLRREWDSSLPAAAVIMINPHTADTHFIDNTTMLVMNNLYRLGYGTANLLNLYTRITERLSLRFNSDEDLLDPHNDEIILKCAEQSDTIIIAWGSAGHNSQRVRVRQAELLEQLKPFSEKIMVITDGGDIAYHPLSPSIRERWILKPFEEVYHAENNNTCGD